MLTLSAECRVLANYSKYVFTLLYKHSLLYLSAFNLLMTTYC
jgi:hypothetical protein